MVYRVIFVIVCTGAFRGAFTISAAWTVMAMVVWHIVIGRLHSATFAKGPANALRVRSPA
jgi:hypothetical protein